MPRRSPRHATALSGATADSAAETSLAETQACEGSFRTEDGTRPESTQGQSATSTGTPRRNPRRGVRKPEENDESMNEPSVSSFDESVHTELGFSVFSSMGSIALETPVGIPEALLQDPDWKHWLEHKKSFLEQYDRLGPLLHDLASGAGPTWVKSQPDRAEPVNDPRQVETVRRISEALEAANRTLAGMTVCCASIKNEAIQAHMSRKAKGLKVMLKNLYDQEVIPLARMKGFKIVAPSTAGPASQSLQGQEDQSALQRAQPDAQPDASRSDHEGLDVEMSTA